MGFIVELVVVSMEKCSSYLYGIEDSFFYTSLKKEALIIFTSFFPKSS
jgi:hypothetical protein